MRAQLIRLSIVVTIGICVGLLVRSASAADTVKSLAADPQRLREVEKACQGNWAGTGETLCTMASKARRRLFMGSGKTPYTPHPVDLFPSLNEDGTPKANGAAPVQAPVVPGAE